MSFNYKECEQSDVRNLIREYVIALSSPIDSFLEDQIFNSAFYTISYNSEVAGYYAVHSNHCLTQFYLELSYFNEAQEIFKNVLSNHSIQSVLVPTCDELFLSLVLDHDFKIEKQAYFFQDSKVGIPKEKLYKDGDFRAAVPNDVIKITKVCQDFIDKVEERIENREIFTFTKGNVLLGIGIVEQSKLLDRYASIGIFTNEQFRKQGIGRTIIHHLKEWCYDNNLNPICGCWYYNVPSKQTLESAGMVSKTRLLNIKVL
ncbi:GNAT family N-acetyltransferase [Peribacillus simplex]|uniref:GNAT family N-acetyltransferase n=1 Tax=Peribacillus simplex TaxID=1478 RepID=UPI0024C0EE55|nr:GNAT family N-acetyltransferase [Peribacillus simplex]WHY98543.1 GNAT family N-acetyltransferase [Peribacillus simplex]